MSTAAAERTLFKSQVSAPANQTAWFFASASTLVATLMAAPLAFGAVQPWAWAGMCILCGVALVLWAAGCPPWGAFR